ncbi:molybdopterin-containing oxidoreductase family protein [Paraburkholderia sediminicola]|uniref:molybdopterin-containing oxidoreductase family protein n=1 Tax=Paraburkholderia sediminicola TaxID=458836 RepID=UPI0038B73A46
MNSSDKRLVKTTCPRDCYDACGIIAVVRAGKVTRVLGDPAHAMANGALCGKCSLAYNGVWLDPAHRLQTPLKRVGPKGSGRYEPINWEIAIGEIARRLNDTINAHGAASVFHTHYTGTCALIAGTFPNRFFNRIGATEVDPDSVCNKAGHEALRLMFGNSLLGFDPRASVHADCLLIWGANPSASAPHVHKHWLPNVQKNAKIIVVDPIRHDTAAMADLHLQVRPGTDALLAFSILHVLRRDGLINDDFIERSVQGWDEVTDQIDAATPDSAAPVTGVPAESIELAASWFAAGRSMLWYGQGVQRQAQGGNVMRSVGLLPTATGNFGFPGTGFLYMNAPPARGIDMDWLCATHLRESNAASSSVSHMDLAEVLANSTQSKALFTWNNNIAASSPDQKRLRQALQREDLFHVALDLFPTDTTNYADYVLPAASFLEFDDLILSYFDYTVSPQSKAVEPMGDSLSNQEIFRRLAVAMELEDAPLHESDEEMLQSMLVQLGLDISFSDLKETGTVLWRDEVVVHFAGEKFPTASGKIDVASEYWTTEGMTRAPHAVTDRPPKENYLRVLSPSDYWLMNSSYANDERILKRIGEQTVWLNPADMLSRGLSDGQHVILSNDAGELRVAARASDRVPVSVALLPKGRWPSIDGSGGNVNILNGGMKSDMASSSAVHSIEVALRAVV